MKASSDSCSSPLSKSRSKTTTLRTRLIVLVRSVTVVTIRCWWVTPSSTTVPSITKLVPRTRGNHLLVTRGRCGKVPALKRAVGVQSAGNDTAVGDERMADSSTSTAPADPAVTSMGGVSSAIKTASRRLGRRVISGCPFGEANAGGWIGVRLTADRRGRFLSSFAPTLPEAQVEGRHHEQVEQGRGK